MGAGVGQGIRVRVMTGVGFRLRAAVGLVQFTLGSDTSSPSPSAYPLGGPPCARVWRIICTPAQKQGHGSGLGFK